MGDEGFGIHVARRLRDAGLPENVRIETGGVAGFDLLGHFTGVQDIIVVDVMRTDLEPGQIAFLEFEDGFSAGNRGAVSFHQMSFLELMQIAELIGLKPRIRFLVTVPVSLDWSLDLTPPVSLAADKAVEFITELFKPQSAA
jgi:hydrogenase maturation protease